MSTPSAALAPAPVPAPQAVSRPAKALVVEHQDGESRLVFLNLEKHERRPLHPFAAEVRWPVFGPDGNHVFYSSGSELHMIAIGQEKDTTLVEGIYTENARPYSFSPDGQTLTVLTSDDVRFFPASELTPVPRTRRTVLPPGCKFVDMAWSLSSNSLLVLCYPSPTTGDYELIRIERSTGQMQSRSAPGIKRLLGWRDAAQLVVVRDRNGYDEPGIMQGSGAFEAVRAHESDTAEMFVEAYVPGLNEMVFAKPTEDSSDPARLLLAPAGLGHARHWLSAFPKLGELRFSSDGKYAVFSDRSRFPENTPEQGGDVYMVETGQEDAELLLRGTPEKVSYSSPGLQP